MVYVIAMALTTAALVHTALFYGRTIWEGVKGNRVEEDDVHARLMRSYPEVPKWCVHDYPLLSDPRLTDIPLP